MQRDILERRLLQLDAVAHISHVVAATDDLEGVMQQVAKIVNRLLNGDLCIVFRTQPCGNALVVAAEVGMGEATVGNFTVPAGNGSREGFTLHATKPVVVDDYRTETRFAVSPWLTQNGAISGLSVTIQGRERPFGVLTLDSKRHQQFTQDDASFFLTVANVLAAFVQRRQAEDALRQSETELRNVLSSDLIGMVKWTADGRITDANDAFLHLLGYKREELTAGAIDWKAVTPAEYQAVDAHAIRALRDTGRCTPFEKEFFNKDGKGIPVLIWAIVLSGETDRGFAFVLDLTETKRAETAGYKLMAIIEGSEDAILGEDREGKIIGWNPGAERLYGYRADEVLGRNIAILSMPDQIQAMNKLKERVWQGERLPSFETVRKKKDGSLIDVSLSISPVRDRAGRVVAISKIAHDISIHKRAEAELRLRDRAMQAVASGVLITDAHQSDYPIIYASPGFEKLTGYSESEVVGRNGRLLQGKNTDHTTVAQVRAAIQAEEPIEVELLNYRKDGTPFWNQLAISPVRDEAGRLTHLVGVQTDVTERRRLEEHFRQAQKMEAVGRLAGGVAHDFNNLLTVINGYSDLLLQRLHREDPAREMASEVHKAGERAGMLIRQLLMFSRRSVLEPKVISINDVVSDAEKMLRRLIGEDIILSHVLDPRIGPVMVDPGQLEQAIINLSVNARDAMPRGGRLTIETTNVELTEDYSHAIPGSDLGHYTLLAVSDTGHGMDEATKSRIFEPFFTTKEPGKGTGLGLAMVYGFVKSSKGHIAVYSVPGHGTTFKLYFPHVQARVSSGKSSPGIAKLPTGTETVLLVEDDDAVRALTRHVLQNSGYTVLEAGDGREAVRLAEGHRGPIHLLVTDVVMPYMGGREVAERVTAIKPGIKMLYCSGYTDDAVVRHGVLEAGIAFVQKPYSPALLAHKVRDVLDDKRDNLEGNP